ncbi:MAG TPA: peroxiredoxin [Candidatus Binataceae bacterium]|nr:peroxiredoxin [Candidatus Binataceae bacterium]
MPRQVEELRKGGILPAFNVVLRDQHGAARRLLDFVGTPLVLFFYPKDETPGCTIEGKEFRDLHGHFTELGCAVIGVSTDSVASHRAFAANHGFPFILLSDEQGELARDFGVLGDGAAERATFVIDRDGRVARVFHDVNPRGHAEKVLGFVRTLIESHLMIGG